MSPRPRLRLPPGAPPPAAGPAPARAASAPCSTRRRGATGSAAGSAPPPRDRAGRTAAPPASAAGRATRSSAALADSSGILPCSGGQLDDGHPVATLPLRCRFGRLDQRVPRETLADGRAQRAGALPVQDAHGADAGHHRVVEVRLELLQRVLHAPAAHVE